MADMLNRYIELKSCLDKHFSGDNHLIEYLMSPGENAIIENLVKDMPKLLSVTKALHREIIDLSSVRALFDETCRTFKGIDQENNDLGSNARIVKSKHFETGVVKLLERREIDMALCEKIACATVKKL